MIRLAGCVLTNSAGHIGLLHRFTQGFDWWELPGGKVETGESDEEAAVRELFEELGVTVSRTRLIGSATFTHGSQEYQYVWFEALEFKGIPTIKEPDIFDGFKFFPTPPASDVTTSPNVKLLLRKLGY